MYLFNINCISNDPAKDSKIYTETKLGANDNEEKQRFERQ